MVELKITGIDRAQTFRPGDILTGAVQLLVSGKEKPFAVQEIRAYFNGRCSVRRVERAGRGEAEYTSDIQLSDQRQVLFSGPETLKSTQSWNFKFRVPEELTVAKPQTFRLRKDLRRLFDDSQKQSMPPSMDVETKRGSGSVRCSVSYMVNADISLPGVGVSKVCSISIPVLRYCTIPAPVPKMISYADHQTVPFDARTGDRKLTMGEKLKTKLKSDDKLPQLQYMVEFEAPDAVIVGEEITISAGARLKDNTKGQTLPLIELKKCSVHVVRQISAASPDSRSVDAAESFDMAVNIGSWDPMINASYPGAVPKAPVLLNNRIDIGQLMKRPLTLREKDFSLAFRTFNISESHHIKIVATIGIANKAIEIALQSKPITLFSPFNRPPEPDVGALEKCKENAKD